MMANMVRVLVITLSTVLALLLGWVILHLPAPVVRLPQQVTAQLGASGVKHEVTAVLLNFRGYDTLLEVAVLLLALIGMLSTKTCTAPPLREAAHPGPPLLQALARVLAPLMVLVAGHLLWAGSHRPGGAFQAGAVLAAAAVLLHLARLLPAWKTPGLALRAGLVSGLLLFLAVATSMLVHGTLLQYRHERAGMLILLIEAGLTLSLGLILAGLFLSLSTGSEVKR